MAAAIVVNIRRGASFDVYIGRRGHGHDGYFGNPFVSDAYSRETAVKKFRTYFLRRIETDPEFKRRVSGLRGKKLGCFCAPRACHGDVIVAWLEMNP